MTMPSLPMLAAMMGGAGSGKPAGKLNLSDLFQMPPCAICVRTAQRERFTADQRAEYVAKPAVTLAGGSLVCEEHTTKALDNG